MTLIGGVTLIGDVTLIYRGDFDHCQHNDKNEKIENRTGSNLKFAI